MEQPRETASPPSSPEAVRAPEVTHRVNKQCHCKGHLLLRDCQCTASVLVGRPSWREEYYDRLSVHRLHGCC